MNLKKRLETFIQGWLPKEPNLAYALKASKPRWRKPYWITLMVVAVVALAAITFVGVRAYMHYSNPAMDVAPSPYYEKTTNSTSVGIGDIVEVNIWVYWHGYVIPEFKRDVKIVDPYSGYFTLASQTNVYYSKGYGGGYQLKYELKVIGGEGVSTELPEPRLYLDNVEIPLEGTSPTIEILSK